MSAPLDRTTTIGSPRNAWCATHWSEIASDPTVNSVYASMRLITRTLELDRFVDLCWPAEYRAEKPEPARISDVLAEIAPICCWLGADELALLRYEARSIGGRRS